ncbi:hypothetical protein FRC0061_00363 [Corynebacterium diphtheriae]|nr:hypothetical protein FRC0061_00363 [Corynebacterium diphtheriae]
MSIFRPKIDITHQYVYSFDMSSTTFDPNRPFNELPPLPITLLAVPPQGAEDS